MSATWKLLEAHSGRLGLQMVGPSNQTFSPVRWLKRASFGLEFHILETPVKSVI